jgi:hypothetical protein
MNGRLTAAAGALVAASLLAAGCGSGGGTTTTSAAVDWANSLCSATTTWQNTLTDTASSLKSGPHTGAALDEAAGKVKDATRTYLDSLKNLGTPETQSGQDAKAAVDELQTQLQSGVDTMEKATTDVSGVSAALNAVSVVSATLATMGNDVKSTVTTLQQQDVKGDLQQAFTQADACAPYTS